MITEGLYVSLIHLMNWNSWKTTSCFFSLYVLENAYDISYRTSETTTTETSYTTFVKWIRKPSFRTMWLSWLKVLNGGLGCVYTWLVWHLLARVEWRATQRLGAPTLCHKGLFWGGEFFLIHWSKQGGGTHILITVAYSNVVFSLG